MIKNSSNPHQNTRTQPIRQLIRNLSVMIAASASFFACKQGISSDVKTLDAIASGGITKLYQCKGNNDVRIGRNKIHFDRSTDTANLPAAKQQSIKNAVNDYFSAIDPGMQELFLQLGGQVLITSESKIGDYCRAARGKTANGSTTQDAIHGCFVFVDDPNGQQKSIFSIVHTDSESNIRYFGPQIFGYLYAQFYSRLVPATQKSAKFHIAETESMQFIQYKESIADAFLADMLASKRYDINNLNPLLGNNATNELQRHANQNGLLNALSLRRAGDASNLSTAELNSRRSQVRDYFFAHAFQSMNCTDESLSITQEHFPKSHRAYQLVNAALLKLSSSLHHNQFTLTTQNDNDGDHNSELALAAHMPDGVTAKNFDLTSILTMVMPLLSGGGGGGGIGDIGSILQQLLGSLPTNSTASTGLLGASTLTGAGVDGLFSAFQSSGCPGGNCGVASANGGSCSGGNCAGNGCSGSCGCATCVTS